MLTVFEDVKMHLLKEKAVWIPSEGALLLADTHFGKAAHFRKAGIPISEATHNLDFARLAKLIRDYGPRQVFFLGDLFHSDYNSNWNSLQRFIATFSTVGFHLVKGNHDILPTDVYDLSGITVYHEPMTMGRIILSHEPLKEVSNEHVNLCGHIHPGIPLVGKGRQRMTLPCFFYKNRQLILPSFGGFTGLYCIKADSSASVFLVTPSAVIPMRAQMEGEITK